MNRPVPPDSLLRDAALPGAALPGITLPSAADPGGTLPGSMPRNTVLPDAPEPGGMVPEAALGDAGPLEAAQSRIPVPGAASLEAATRHASQLSVTRPGTARDTAVPGLANRHATLRGAALAPAATSGAVPPATLQRRLSTGQLSMIAIGGAIGTGLFLGSGFAISLAGPAVLVSYAIGGLVALLLMGCLAEMTVVHPSTGSFGWLAQTYVSPLAGYLVRYAYWSANVLAVGTEVTAVALYMRYWAPGLPGWWWILGFSGVLVAVNAASVRLFGWVEYGFSFVKIAAILAFLVLGGWTVLHGAGAPGVGLANYTRFGGFLPHGLSGMWVAVVVSIFSYLGIETIAVAAGEAADPERVIVRALRTTMGRLAFFYLATLAVMLAVMPWTRAAAGTSPFVSVMVATGVPGAAALMNGVILVAALSAMNTQIYAATRMLFSLAQAGYAPAGVGSVSQRGVPLTALLLSTAGIAVAAILYVLAPDEAFTVMIALSMFGAMFTWGMIFVTHLCFRAARRGVPGRFAMWGYPWTSLLGAGLMTAILVTTAFTSVFRLTLAYGLPFIGLLAVLYAMRYRTAR